MGVYWCFNLVNAAPLTRARHRPFVSWRMHCPACGAHCTEAGCDHPDSFVAEIPVEGVMEAARQLLAAGAA